jgi:ADP-heptose:LPS heptosyltransferase
VRPDRIGDVILSTPVLEMLRRHYPRSHVTVLVRAAVAPLLSGLAAVDEVAIFEPEGRHRGLNGLFTLIEEFRAADYRIAVALHSHWKIAAALYAARVPYRVGPRSKPHSYLFYNRGVRQRRSQVEMHEADYNLQLLRRLGIRAATRTVAPKVHLSDEARAGAREWLRARGFDPAAGAPLVAVHSGMAGSALNWPEAHYADLIRALTRDGVKVLATFGPSEGALRARMEQALGDVAGEVIFHGGPESGPIDQLAGVLSWTHLVIAPSTGPLHLAVALGKRVVTFYPPIRVQSAIRWGPYVPSEERASILVPEVYCGEDFRCRGNLCNYFPCMRSLTVTQAVEEARRQLAAAQAERAEPAEPSQAERAEPAEPSNTGREEK